MGGERVAREKFGTLTEQMFYILLCLREECCGMDVMARVNELTGGIGIQLPFGVAHQKNLAFSHFSPPTIGRYLSNSFS